MRKIMVLLLAMGFFVQAADHKKHWIACIVGGGYTQCTKPLEKEVAESVAYILAHAPIGGLDYTYIQDINAKGKDHPQPVAPQAPPSPPVRYENNL